LTAATRGEPGHPGATATGEGRNGVEAATAAADRAGGTIESIVGVIAVRNGSHVSLLFVDPSLHGRGIGRRLFAAALMEMRRRQPDLDCVTVNSSDFAIPFYRALGFEPSSEPFFSKGTKITPMRNILR
jgi:GNAT superfamily N-acetyltransferase